jgi:hypothetical protein
MLVKDILNLIKNQKRLIITISTDTESKTTASISNVADIITLYGDKAINRINISTYFNPDMNIPEKPEPVLHIVIEERSTNEVSDKVSNEDILKSINELHKNVDKLPSYKDMKNVKSNYDNDWSMI